MRTAALIYPHQLFSPHPAVAGADEAILIEDPLFFSHYSFHRQKLILHRASLQRYAAALRDGGVRVRYLEAAEMPSTASVVEHLRKGQISMARVVDPCDDWLSQRLSAACKTAGIRLDVLEHPHFLTKTTEIEQFGAGTGNLFFTRFYIGQRQRLGVLLERGKPVGGKWSFDGENRKKLPSGTRPPEPTGPRENKVIREARDYVRKNFPDAPGSDDGFHYPTSSIEARAWLAEFLEQRLHDFGPYEDAISRHHAVLFHSVLTPVLNIGLLSPREVLEAALRYQHEVPMNSLEGFIRQLIGWREFVRLVYLTRGRRQRTRNYWKHSRPLPSSFYSGATGIEPVDHVIRAVLEHGYCHHIERLMILGNFMLLCEIDPDDVYRWFMELFIDAYDWVMVPNVYGMSQYADGGLMTTKPYISGSSYVLRMSDFERGPWCAVWDALYWRFVDRHSDFFAANPRMAVMVRMKDKLGAKLASHLRTAEDFLARLTD
jgi:deoxyribodipyrimidine photolyase-related protein